METYAQYSPTAFDRAGAFLEDDRQEWLVVPVSRNRDSGPFAESNFSAALSALDGESDDCEVYRFGHWGPGWFEIILVRPGSEAAEKAEDVERRLQNYPALDEDDLSERETEEANRVWKQCYDLPERVAYVRSHREQFEFRDFVDMLGCMRGNYFAGYASELISR